MQNLTSKENILKKIRKALINKAANPFPKIDLESSIYHVSEDLPEVRFATELKNASGQFVYCESEQNLIQNIQDLINKKGLRHIFCWESNIQSILKENDIKITEDEKNINQIDVAITLCECLIARTGSIWVSSRQQAGRRLTIYTPIHIVIGYASQLVNDIGEGIEKMKIKYGTNLPSMISLVTGPSRTADIEKTLVMGAHGPKELYVFYVDDLQ